MPTPETRRLESPPVARPQPIPFPAQQAVRALMVEKWVVIDFGCPKWQVGAAHKWRLGHFRARIS